MVLLFMSIEKVSGTIPELSLKAGKRGWADQNAGFQPLPALQGNAIQTGMHA